MSTVEISKNFVAFSEYMNFKKTLCRLLKYNKEILVKKILDIEIKIQGLIWLKD